MPGDQIGVLLRRRARLPRSAVELALEVGLGVAREKVKVAVRFVVVAAGPVRIVVFGASCRPTTVQVWLAGVGSALSVEVDRAHLEGVLAGLQLACTERAHALLEAPRRRAALEGRGRLVAKRKVAKLSGVDCGGRRACVVSGAVVSGSIVQV